MTRVLIAGGYGVVGSWIARHLHAAGHDIDLVIGGRPDAGAELARELGATVALLDSADARACLADVGPVDLVISALQDPEDGLLTAALRTSSAHIGIVRKTDNMCPTAMAAAALACRPERLLGMDRAQPPSPGLLFPEGVIEPRTVLARLRDFGVHIDTTPAPSPRSAA